MVQCCVQSCKNRSDCQGWKKRSNSTSNLNISFYRFLKNPTTRNMWLDSLGMSSLSISTTARICSDHFEEKYVDRRGLRIRLKPNALPSRILKVEPLFPSNSTVAEQSSSNEESPDKTVIQKIDHSLRSVVPTENVITTSLSPITNISLSQPSISKVDNATMVFTDDLVNLSKKCILLTQLSTAKMDKGTMVSPALIYNSPEKCRLRRRIKFLEVEHAKKIRSAQQQIRRYKDQVATLKSVLNTLKNNQLLNETQADMIHTLGESVGDIFMRLIRRKENEHISKQYTPEVRSFALTLHYYSPRTYEYVRDQFDKCLPHAKTISSWYRTVKGEPSISSEEIRSITERVQKQIICYLAL